MKIRHFVFTILALCVVCAVLAEASTSVADYKRAAVIDGLSGTVNATQNEIEMPAFRGFALLRRDRLGTGAESWSSLELDEGRFAIVEENTHIQIAELTDGLTGARTTRVYMSDGKVWFDVSNELSENESFEVRTPTSALSVRGTVFSVTAAEEETTLTVYAGKVNVRAEKEDGTPLLDRHGNEVYMEVSSGKARITVMLGGVFRVTQSELTLEDLIPFLRDGGAGAGGVHSVLRSRMSSNQNFMHLLELGVNDMTPANMSRAVERLGGSASGIPSPPSIPRIPRVPW